MLLYHFPLNTQESIENFTNKGIRGSEFQLKNGGIVQSENKGIISAKCANPNGDKLYIDLTQYSTISICFRVFADSNFAGGQSWRTIFGLNASYNQDNPNISLFTTQNSTYFAVGTSENIPLDDKWHNFIFVVDNDRCIIYYDNQVKRDTTNANIHNYRHLAFWGRLANNTYNIAALTQDIRIYDYALSQAEINEYSRALVVHYPLQGNELNSSVLKDVSGFRNDIILKSDDCFNSITDFVRGNKIQQCRSKFIGTDMRQSGGAAYGQTISLWVRQNFATASMSGIWTYLFTHRIYDGENSDFSYLANGAGRQALWNNKNSISMPLTADKLYHIAIVYNGTTRKIYANGVVYNTSNVTLNSFNINYILKGNGGNDARYDKCISIVDFRIYATALSAEDIKNLYNSPIAVSKQHQTIAFEFKENTLYPSKYWRTPTYAEMNYILNTRTNAANLRTLGRVEISSGVYRNGLFLLPDGFVAPSGITVTITTANYTTNSYTLTQFKQLENVGVVFLPDCSLRKGTALLGGGFYYISSVNANYHLEFYANDSNFGVAYYPTRNWGMGIRLICNGKKFSTSATTKIDFAQANLQYHCTQHIWRFAEHSYDIIGADNANISDTYNGWIDLFGYGTSGVNYSPTLHSTTNSDYASGDIANTDNDWGINEIQSYDYNMKNFALNKNGIVQHNELRENDSDVNGCYNDKLITNELTEQ